MKIKLKTIVICCALLAFTQWNCAEHCVDSGTLPDLRYASCIVAQDPFMSNKFNVETLIKNDVLRITDCDQHTSSVATTHCVSITYKASARDTTWLPAESLTFNIPLLHASEQVRGQFSFMAPMLGVYRFCFALDCKNSVVESNEDNNTICHEKPF